jgi:MscS family membrane protein
MDFLDHYFLDNTIKSYLVVLGVILAVYLLKKFVTQSIANILYYPVKLIWKEIDRKQFIYLLLKPLGWFILICVALATISRLNYPQFLDFKIYKFSFDKILEKIAVLIFVFSFIRLCLSIVDFISLILTQKASKTISRSDDQMVIASFIIFLDKPFYVGDIVKVNAVSGVVETIGLRNTRIRTTDKSLVTVPNKQMVDSVVDNLSFRTGRRVEMKLEVSENTSADTAKLLTEKIQQLIVSLYANDITSSSVYITDFSKNGIVIMLEYFTPNISIQEFNTIRQKINAAIIQLIKEEKIQFAAGSNNITIVSGNSGSEPSGSKSII